MFAMRIARFMLRVPLGQIGKLALAAPLFLILATMIASSQAQEDQVRELGADAKARQATGAETSQEWTQWGGPHRNFI